MASHHDNFAVLYKSYYAYISINGGTWYGYRTKFTSLESMAQALLVDADMFSVEDDMLLCWDKKASVARRCDLGKLPSYVNSHLAASDKISPLLLDQLAREGDKVYLGTIAMNNRVSDETTRYLFGLTSINDHHGSIEGSLLRALLGNHLLPGDLIEQVFRKTSLFEPSGNSSFDIVSLIAHNANTPESILSILSRNEDRAIREAVATNTGASPRLLMSMIDDDHPDVLMRLTMNKGLNDADRLKVSKKLRVLRSRQTKARKKGS